ncbi:hypothetical protein DTO169C6_2745 [Paecilomyces variotii]|nr:hypothetical protein DTO169C6_2745 [Paecilomyces variotii]
MTRNLPFEVISHIAECLHSDDCPLAQYTVVCRQWQAAFESFIYSNLTVYSEEVEDGEAHSDVREVHKELGELWGTEFYYPPLPDWYSSASRTMKKKTKKTLSLSRFAHLISGTGTMRQGWVRYIKYRIVVPYLIEDWKTIKAGNYSYKNSIRDANDEAFKSGIVGLFEVLSSWSGSHRVALELGLFGRELGKEPCTDGHPDAGDYDWDFTNGRTVSVRPYRARFPLNDDASMLPKITCIDSLFFLNWSFRNGVNKNHRIWAGTVFQIVASCPTVTKLELDLNEYVRPDHEGFMMQRRQAVAEGLKKVPHSLRVLNYKNGTEMNWKETMPALNLLPPSGIDHLSINLHDLSFRLRELRIEQTALSLDFLCPLNSSLEPISDISSCIWPRLETMIFELVPRVTPSGKWLFQYTPERQAEIDEIDDWDMEICHPENGWLTRQLMDLDAFHRLFVSIGYAVQRMPRLSRIRVFGDFAFENAFDFFCERSTGTFTARWLSESSYEPNQQVASAWKFCLEDMEVDDRGRSYGSIKSTVKFPVWPPLP